MTQSLILKAEGIGSCGESGNPGDEGKDYHHSSPNSTIMDLGILHLCICSRHLHVAPSPSMQRNTH